MGFTRRQILAIDRHRADNFVVEHCQPNLVTGLLQSFTKLSQPRSHFGLEEATKIMLPRIITAMHLRDTANHARDIPLHYLQLIGLHIVAHLPTRQQRVGIKGEPLRNGQLLGRSKTLYCCDHALIAEGINFADRLVTFRGQPEALCSRILGRNDLLEFACGNQASQHPADAGLFQAQQLYQLTRRHLFS